MAALRKRIDRLDSDNKDCKNTAGLSFVREVMEGGFASSEQQLNETKQQLLDHQNAIDIVDQLKCGAEPPDGQLVDYLKAMQSRSQTTCPPWERPDGGHHAGW